MTGEIVLPTWAAVVAAVGTPLLAFLGVVFANRVTLRGAAELETRSQREETMRNLRWAAELAVSEDPRQADLGLHELNALSVAADEEQQVFIDAALESVYGQAEDAVDEATGEGFEVLVEVRPDPDAGPGDGVESDHRGREGV